jgi:hypothetical protein
MSSDALLLPPAPLQSLADLHDMFRAALSAFAEYVRSPCPIMVDRTEAARLCGMSVATYDKNARKGLLPRMNAAGRVSVETLKRACLKLDGIADSEAIDDPAEHALKIWERK